MESDAAALGEDDDPRGRHMGRGDDTEHYAGAAGIAGVALAGDADAEEARPGVHDADEDRHAGEGQSDGDRPDAVGEVTERRQALTGAWHYRDEFLDISEIGADKADGGNRIA